MTEHDRRNPRLAAAARAGKAVTLGDLSPQDRDALKKELLQSMLDGEETAPALDIETVKAMSVDEYLERKDEVDRFVAQYDPTDSAPDAA